MRYLIGSGGGVPLYEHVRRHIPDVAKLLSPSDWRTPFCPYALDNGVYGAWLAGRE